MNQLELQQLAEERVQDARALLDAGRWSSAYYLIGYAVECGMKACILAYLTKNAGIIFEEGRKKYSENCWTHEIERLVELAALGPQRQSAIEGNASVARNWLIVKDWKESSRYELKSQAEAERLFDAVTNNPDGVLAWIKSHW